ncbi:MAG: pantoate--beta-alanine ligase [Candidatus Calescibacterium sp.]|nr:pantoate--beta-alanine ligase [Candidatus Calescibacterium sp.]MCX7734431.1 pantoate--beta-alanine ligase [bacterium]MDW8086803.1 pantoate--beta-alanine ligase [Candidatus Calescibacterium sp.]
MQVIRKIDKMKQEIEKIRGKKKTIGFVPTMGYLHDGHVKLIREARNSSDKVVVSIFVNPTQFGPQEDYERYPRDEKRDLRICKNEKVDYVFIPTAKDMYPDDFETYVELSKTPNHLCGLSRPGHFKGVATVLVKLFNIVNPHISFFGLKDFQQTVVVQKLVKDLNIGTKIKTVETVRDKDGLALSSRNSYLSDEERIKALSIPRSLIIAKKEIENGETDAEKIKNKMKKSLEENGVKVDYVEIVDRNTLDELKEVRIPCAVAVAGFVGKTRLIDNIIFEKKGKILNLPKIKMEV